MFRASQHHQLAREVDITVLRSVTGHRLLSVNHASASVIKLGHIAPGSLVTTSKKICV